MIPHSSLGKEVIVYCTFPGDPANETKQNKYIYPFSFNLKTVNFFRPLYSREKFRPHNALISHSYCQIILRGMHIHKSRTSPPPAPSEHTSVGGIVLNQSNQGGMEIHNDHLRYLFLLNVFLFMEHHKLNHAFSLINSLTTCYLRTIVTDHR